MSQALSQQSTRLRSLWVIGHKVTPLTVGNRVVVVEVTTPVGVPGPPAHYHEDCAEFFFVTAGRLGVMKDGDWASLGPGDHVEVPRGVIHTFRNEGDEAARTITGFDPMGFERFFEEFGCDTTEPGAFETSVSEDTIRRVVEGCARFGMIIAPTQQGTRDNPSDRGRKGMTQTAPAMDSVPQNQDATPLALARALVEAIESHELDRVPALYAANTRIEDPGGAVFETGEALKAHLGRLIEAFPDIHHEVIHTIESEDSAAIQGRITGTHTGTLALPGGTVPPTGRRIDLRFAFLVRAQHGAIVRDDLYFDRADMNEQLGLP